MRQFASPKPSAASATRQPKLVIGHSSDSSEREADRIADTALRMREGTTPVAKPAFASNAAHRTLPSTGSPLDPDARRFFEPRMATDFSAVRVHTDARAASSAAAIGAKAYSLGSDIVFGRGQYDPGSNNGRRLIGHELAHVTQQRRSSDEAHTIRRQTEKGGPGLVEQQKNLPDFRLEATRKGIEHWMFMDKLKRPIAEQIATAYVNRPDKPVSGPELLGAAYDNRQPSYYEPTYQEVYDAIFTTLQIRKITKGNQVESWALDGLESRPKTHDEKVKEAGWFAAKQFVSPLGLADEPVSTTVEMVVEKAGEKATATLEALEAGAEVTAKWVTREEMMGVLRFVSLGARAFWAVSLVMGILELAEALKEPMTYSFGAGKGAKIVGDVRAWLLKQAPKKAPASLTEGGTPNLDGMKPAPTYQGR